MDRTFEIHPLEIDFTETRCGWIHFTLKLGEHSFETRFTEVFDPILFLKRWLEAISIGVWQCSFIFDTEGEEYRFNFESLSWKHEEFSVIFAYEPESFLMRGCVDRRQLVEAFYRGFLNYRESPAFDRREWEVELLTERLQKASGAGHETLVHKLSRLSCTELADTLYKIDPQEIISYTNVGEFDQLKVFIESEVEGKPLPSGAEKVTTKSYWEMPEGYDAWPLDERQRFVEKCLNSAASGYTGTKLSELKSRIIDDFLKGLSVK